MITYSISIWVGSFPPSSTASTSLTDCLQSSLVMDYNSLEKVFNNSSLIQLISPSNMGQIVNYYLNLNPYSPIVPSSSNEADPKKASEIRSQWRIMKETNVVFVKAPSSCEFFSSFISPIKMWIKGESRSSPNIISVGDLQRTDDEEIDHSTAPTTNR